MRKIITSCLLCLVLFLQNSCLTKELWGDKHYDEEVRQFYVSSGGKYVVLVGNKYHYVFSDESNVFKTMLSLRQRGTLTVNLKKSYLKLDSSNNVSGKIIIDGPFDILSLGDREALRFIGFRPDEEDNISIKINISGQRYQARQINDGRLPSMATDYKIPIYYYDSNFAKNVGKAAVTPIAVSIDAVVLIGDVILFPLNL